MNAFIGRRIRASPARLDGDEAAGAGPWTADDDRSGAIGRPLAAGQGPSDHTPCCRL